MRPVAARPQSLIARRLAAAQHLDVPSVSGGHAVPGAGKSHGLSVVSKLSENSTPARAAAPVDARRPGRPAAPRAARRPAAPRRRAGRPRRPAPPRGAGRRVAGGARGLSTAATGAGAPGRAGAAARRPRRCRRCPAFRRRPRRTVPRPGSGSTPPCSCTTRRTATPPAAADESDARIPTYSSPRRT